MTLQIEFLAQAEADVQSALSWYLERSPAAAERFLTELDRGLALIVAAPGIWPTYEAGTQQYPLRRFPHKVIYQVVEGQLIVVAVAHHRRKPGLLAIAQSNQCNRHQTEGGKVDGVFICLVRLTGETLGL